MKVGPGLLIMHGNGTYVLADAIGENCTIYQQVTIGKVEEGLPTIGNNVKIYAGAKNSWQGNDRRQCEYWSEFCSAKGCSSQCDSAWGSRCCL